MFRSARLLSFVSLSALLLLTATLRAQEPAQPAKPSTIWDPEGIPDFKFTDRTGTEVTKETLLGKPWVAGFIFTRCQGPCPLVTGQMKRLREQTGVQLVTFDVDPEFDTPEVLTRYAEVYAGLKPGEEQQWYFLTGDKNAIYRYIHDAFRMPVKEVTGPDRQPGFEVIHSVNLMLVDAQGRVVGKYNAQRDEEMAKLRRILQGKEKMPVPEDSVQEGTSLPGGLRLIPAKPSEPATPVNGESAEAPKTSLSDQEAQWQALPAWVRTLPMVNASLNAIAGILLGLGYVLIRTGHREAHKWTMLTAF
ncbi:MAG TPA: SCO family protein, partial [Planctomycetaceae bacterium]|nr:SCO family protein [Planctomycetaceae bacterium]